MKINKAKALLNKTTGFGNANSRSNKGMAAAAMSEPRETYLHMPTTAMKTTTSIRITKGAK